MSSLIACFIGITLLSTPSWAQQGAQVLEPVSSAELPSFEIDSNTTGEDSKAALLSSVQKQLDQCLLQDPKETWNFAGTLVTRQEWCVKTAQWFIKKLNASETLEEVYQAAKTELRWFRSKGRPNGTQPNEVLYTGYFHPLLKAKRVKDSVYQYPIYKRPANANLSRAQIVEGALNGKGLEIAYVTNPVDPFLLEVQGSGALMIQNDDGTETKVLINFSGTNGYPYTSLGRVMREAGIPEDYINMQGIRRYFIEEHPEKWKEFSNRNQSYVFFKEENEGPYGAAGVILTPGHSIAVDYRYFPYGAMALVQSERPVNLTGTSVDAWKPFFQFMLAQDTGGAIKGPGHVDIYWGSGEYAELVAGHSKQIGQLFFCLP